MTRFFSRLRHFLAPARTEQDLAREIEAHLALLEDGFRERGMSVEDARRAARLALGGVDQTKEQHRDARSFLWLDDAQRDIQYALRSLKRNPSFTAVTVLTLAVSVAANTAVFSVADALLLRPLPYQDADRLVALRATHGSADVPDGGRVSALDLADWQAQARSFDAMTGYRWRTVDLRGGAYAERLRGLYVTTDYFRVFGITDVNGRTFSAEDAGTRRIILSRGVWERRFGADPSLIGSTLDVNMINLGRSGATPHIVVGATQADVHFPPLTADFNLGVEGVDSTIDFWLPEYPPGGKRYERGFDVVAKLRPGVTLTHAQSEMDAIARHLAEAFPDTNKGWGVQLVPLRAQVAGDASRVILLLSLGTGLVLLIACGNVSTLLLVRSLAQQREVAVRWALGASRLRIARQFVLESLVISLAAAAVGLVGAVAGIHLLTPWFPASVPLIHRVGLNTSVFGFTLATAALTTGLTGLVPAWISSTRDVGAAGLHARGQSGSRWQHRAIGALTAAQVALTVILLVSTGLLLRSADHLWHVDPGFDPRNVLTMTISLPNNKFDWQHNVEFEREVTASIKTLPGVRDAAAIQGVPMRAGGFWTAFSIEGLPPTAPADLPLARMRVISAGYFQVMHIPLLDGRDFDERDDAGERGHPKSVIVNQTLAARYWPGEHAVGKRLNQGFNPDEWVTVAGVVADVRYTGLDAPPEMEIYLPDGIFPEAAITLLVKTTQDPRQAAADIRARIAHIDREAFVSDVRTMTELLSDSLASRVFTTLLITICAGVALALALSGIYGIVSQAAVQRKLEIGIRIALGATPRRIITLMLQRATLPVIAGAVIGLAGTLATVHLLSALLFGIQPFDPLTFAAAIALFTAVAFVSAVIPARRATHVNPLVALRCE